MRLVYRWSTVSNWGDRLSVHLLRHWSQIPVGTWDVADECDILGVGSTVGHVLPEWNGVILGAGALLPSERVPWAALTLGVRGKLTRERMHGSPASVVLGDPGLIADELVERPKRTHRLGILPHWSDTDLMKRREFWRYDPLFISPGWNEIDVIRMIGSCDKLITSSLHGMILADAFGIPRRFEEAPRLRYEGGTFKHEDYSSAIGHEFKVGVTSAPRRFVVNDVRDRLIDMYEQYGQMVRDGMA
jgi:pyruvyltransferase